MKPFPFQKQCVRSVEQFDGRTLFSCDMGLGKSAMSLWYAIRNGKFPMVVVCPASVKWQWQDEVFKVLGMGSTVCEGMRSSPLRDDIVIVNYDIAGGWLNELRRLKPKLIVIDECQYIMNPKAKRTRHVRALCRGVKHVLALSGTPLVNRPIELFPTLNILQPTVFPSRFHFGLRYCGGRRNRWGWEFRGATKIKELHRLLLNTCMIRRRKEEVLTELPPKIHQVVPVDIEDEATYQRAENDFLSWLAEQDPEAAVRAERAEGLTRTGHLLRLAAKLKLKATIGWLNDWLEATDEKLIVFAVHTKMIEALQRRIKSRIVVVDGSVTGRQRQQCVHAFQNDPSVRVLVGNVQAAGVGLNLTAASTVVFAELPWQPGLVTQASDRAHRIGQVQCVNVYFLVAHGTVEEARCQVISRKQKTVTSVLDGSEVENELDVFDEFVKEIQRGGHRGILTTTPD